MLELSEAQRVVDAIYRDYFPDRPRPPRVIRSKSEGTHYDGSRHLIELAGWALTLDAVLHETAHALVDSVAVDDPGHGGHCLALLLELWYRYLPIVDTDAARAAALVRGLVIADSVRPLLLRTYCPQVLRELLCVHPVRWQRHCRALAGELDAGPEEERGDPFGGRLGEFWWLSEVEADTGARDTTLVRESTEQLDGASLARLSISCGINDRLGAQVWWRDVEAAAPMLFWRTGDRPWRQEPWQTSSGTWSGDAWAVQQAIYAASFLQTLNWQAGSANELQVRIAGDRCAHRASFDLQGLFGSPVQPALARCGPEPAVADAGVLIVDSGRSGDDLWWGVDGDQHSPETYVVVATTMSGSAGEALLQVKCKQGALEVKVYWAVDRDLDRTVVYQIGGGPRQHDDWAAGWARGGEVEYKWTGREDAAGLVAELAWAAQADGALVVEAHEQGDPNRRYLARFKLAGLFASPVQPNLASCGR